MLCCFAAPAFAQDAKPESEKPSAKPAVEQEQESEFDIQGLEAQVQKVLEQIQRCTVSFGGGSGVVINDEGLILTCAHVNRSAGRRIRIRFPDGRVVSGKTLGNFHAGDAGLVQITGEGDFPFAEMAKSGEVEIGDWCIAVGYPVSFRGGQPPVRIGRVLSRSGSSIRTDVPIMGGDSGGPLFDLQGRVIGINSRVSGSMTANIHVATDLFTTHWDRLMDGEDWGQRRGGRGGRNNPQGGRNNPQRGQGRPQRPGQGRPRNPDATPSDAPELKIKVADKDGKAVVTEVEKDGLGDRSGIRTGDIILKINGNDVNNANAFADGLKQSGSLKLLIQRPAASDTRIILPVKRDK